MARLTTLTTSNFGSQVLQSPVPVVVDFSAEWCGPCRMLAPVLEQYAEALAGHVRFVKVDVQESPELAERFGISAVPTLLFFRDGKLHDRQSGLPTTGVMQSKLGGIIRGSAEPARGIAR